jgi:hypothetical protein
MPGVVSIMRALLLAGRPALLPCQVQSPYIDQPIALDLLPGLPSILLRLMIGQERWGPPQPAEIRTRPGPGSASDRGVSPLKFVTIFWHVNLGENGQSQEGQRQVAVIHQHHQTPFNTAAFFPFGHGNC